MQEHPQTFLLDRLDRLAARSCWHVVSARVLAITVGGPAAPLTCGGTVSTLEIPGSARAPPAGRERNRVADRRPGVCQPETPVQKRIPRNATQVVFLPHLSGE